MKIYRWLLAIATMLPICSIAQAASLSAPPPGSTLPILIGKSWKAKDLRPGETITAKLIQRVAVAPNTYLPNETEIAGHVVTANPTTISILFTGLRWKTEMVPIHVRLVAAASAFNEEQTKAPVGGTRGTDSSADWTTRQIGGDEVYRSDSAGKVYDQAKKSVGFANLMGVYANPKTPGGLPRAIGPFSTNAKGLYGFPHLTLVSAGDNGTPIVLQATDSDGEVPSGSTLLLEVTR